MTPKEKAKELFNKFYDIKACEEHQVCERVAKQCAYLAIQEIENLDVWHYTHNAQEGLMFWNEVKYELIKL